MIVDLDRFVAVERPHWQALEAALRPYDQDRLYRPSLPESLRLFELYQRSVADLARLEEASQTELAEQFSALVGRAYAQVHSSRGTARFRPLYWLLHTLPNTFRRQIRPFALALLVTLIGCAIGGVLLKLDPTAKTTLLPFGQLMGDPRDRVKQEEKEAGQKHPDSHASFAAQLMTHNTQVAFFSLACGMTWGLGTMILLFYNGIDSGSGQLRLRSGRSGEVPAWMASAAWRDRDSRDFGREPGGLGSGQRADRLEQPSQSRRASACGGGRRSHLGRRCGFDAGLGGPD